MTGCFWLGDLLPDVVPNARVLSYGYGASRSSIVVVEDFLAELVQLRKLTGVSLIPVALSVLGVNELQDRAATDYILGPQFRRVSN